MKAKIIILTVMVITALLAGCTSVLNPANSITPSNKSMSQSRTVSDFTGIDFSTFGRVNITQGDSESLSIDGRDNIVPLVKTSVQGGTLSISMDKNVNITSLKPENLLTFKITVKDLSSISISGLAQVNMSTLSTSKLNVDMSGAGELTLNHLSAENLDVNVSGLGTVTLGGQVGQATIDISGAGTVNAPDLQIKTASITVPGLGSATLWVTDSLTGDISGAGSVSYYGNPQTSTQATGLGQFKSLGSK